ncbi:phosphatase PAP2 family protein [Oculatella sp. LEGE 06141]|uniref:phosphatase PAP2 family protein n=1 Tax=Oculatella sp. LEGE 06141 TaxID=1828648 RepID=UPI0018803548|nr:phosphatase PAP2 family protein [Oculatella sp. LEGE 06141]MBE9183053.1 phosphatase PAP2 family protein [Oculatella sp. LEGE 06141]
MLRSRYWQFVLSFIAFLKHVLVKRWRSLLVLLLGIFLPLQLFGELAEEVWETEGGFPWDVPILLAIRSTASPQLDAVAVVLTKLGAFWGMVPAAVVVSFLLLRQRHWRSLTYWLTTLLGSVAINRTAKLLLHRVRPHLWESPAPEFDYGFPSGHAMASMTLVVALVILMWGHRRCGWIVGVGGLFVLVIGWTRLYLGVHYPSDILAGWAASLAWAIGVSLVIRPHWVQRTPPPDPARSPY